jgi:hypothetical protein
MMLDFDGIKSLFKLFNSGKMIERGGLDYVGGKSKVFGKNRRKELKLSCKRKMRKLASRRNNGHSRKRRYA